MANNITPKLKAYVQTDATGRVVSGTPVFRTSKPKSGNWREIPMYYRGDNPSSTTTTTTAGGGGGVTPTAWIVSAGFDPVDTCGNIPYLLVYTSQSALGLGVALYLDPTLTQPYSTVAGTYIANNGFVYLMSGSVIGSDAVSC